MPQAGGRGASRRGRPGAYACPTCTGRGGSARAPPLRAQGRRWARTAQAGGRPRGPGPRRGRARARARPPARGAARSAHAETDSGLIESDKGKPALAPSTVAMRSRRPSGLIKRRDRGVGRAVGQPRRGRAQLPHERHEQRLVDRLPGTRVDDDEPRHERARRGAGVRERDLDGIDARPVHPDRRGRVGSREPERERELTVEARDRRERDAVGLVEDAAELVVGDRLVERGARRHRPVHADRDRSTGRGRELGVVDVQEHHELPARRDPGALIHEMDADRRARCRRRARRRRLGPACGRRREQHEHCAQQCDSCDADPQPARIRLGLGFHRVRA